MSPDFPDVLEPYGPLIETVVRVLTWNVWCHFGPWQRRYEAIEAELQRLAPDVVVLTETWHTAEDDPVADAAHRLDLHVARAESWYEPFGLESGMAVLSRWPIRTSQQHRTDDAGGQPGALFQHATIDGPRGDLDIFGVMLDWRPNRSDIRQVQARELATYVMAQNAYRCPAVICGDFNAAPDADEIRALTGRTSAAAPGFFGYDAWDMAGDGSPGHTWSNANAWAASALLPSRRIDYVLSTWPHANGAGHPLSCRLVGNAPADAPPSDHYGVFAELRY